MDRSELLLGTRRGYISAVKCVRDHSRACTCFYLSFSACSCIFRHMLWPGKPHALGRLSGRCAAASQPWIGSRCRMGLSSNLALLFLWHSSFSAEEHGCTYLTCRRCAAGRGAPISHRRWWLSPSRGLRQCGTNLSGTACCWSAAPSLRCVREPHQQVHRQ